uniref:uncharacterized protein n=1 Tax=Myxine glutinosa TaxID=7769 RepID=UPI00358E7FB6
MKVIIRGPENSILIGRVLTIDSDGVPYMVKVSNSYDKRLIIRGPENSILIGRVLTIDSDGVPYMVKVSNSYDKRLIIRGPENSILIGRVLTIDSDGVPYMVKVSNSYDKRVFTFSLCGLPRSLRILSVWITTESSHSLCVDHHGILRILSVWITTDSSHSLCFGMVIMNVGNDDDAWFSVSARVDNQRCSLVFPVSPRLDNQRCSLIPSQLSSIIFAFIKQLDYFQEQRNCFQNDEMPKAKRSKKQEPLKLWRERQASKLGKVPPLPANVPRLPANVSPLPANVKHLPANVSPLPANVKHLPAHVPLLPAHVPPLPGNHQPVPGKAPLLLGHAPPLQNQYGEDRVTNSGGIRRQFPVKLAFGCSIHKIQGCTLKEAVVSLEKIFTAGQAYVALSRVTSMEGLTIQNFKQSAIYCNENVAAAMDKMPKAKRSKKQEPLKLWRERQASKLGNVPPLPANDPRLPANVSPLPANISPLPAHVPLLPAHVPPLPAHVPLLPAHVPPLPGNHQPVPGNHQPVPGKAPLLLGHATPLQNQYAHGHTIEYTTKKTNKSTPESTSEVFIPVGEKRYKTIEGSFHQGHPQFLEDRGQQCVANCCVFVLFDKIKDASSWETPDLDIVLQTGNTLYRFIQSSLTIPHRFLLVSELPEVVKLFDRNFLLKRGESLVGLLNDSTNVAVDIPFLMPLNDALKTALEQYHSCFVNFALTTFAVLKKEHLFCVFDSHSRSSTGTPVCDGRSILMKYTSLQEVYEHCLRLAASMNIPENTQFEVTGMDAVVACEDTVDTVRRSAPNEIDDVSIVKIDSTQYSFHPLTTEVCTNLCAKLGLGKICPQYSSQTNGTATIGDPCKTKAIKMDGNCFFRALSYSISGTEEYHRKIRLAIVKHLFDHHTAFKSFLREGFSSVPQYIQSSRMKYVQTWATELEILAASDLLQTDIFTFSTRWLRYSGSQMHPNDFHSRGGIYLKHLHQNHYEIVECVKLSAESERRCTGINCGSPIPSLKFGIDMDKHEVLSGSEISLPCNSMDQMFTLGGKGKKCKGLRQKKQREKFRQKQKRAKSKLSVNKPMRNPYVDNNLYRQTKKAYTQDRYENDSNDKARRKAHSRLKYENDIEHHETRKRASKTKYKQDEGHKELVKAYSKTKYKHDEGHKESVKAYSKTKYKHDEGHKELELVKAYSKTKYKYDEGHKELVKACSKRKYKHDESHKESVKACSKTKYAKIECHREDVRARSVNKYKSSKLHRETLKQRNVEARCKKQTKNKEMTNIIANFKEKVSHGPNHICCVCHQRFFKNQVLPCRRESYEQKGLLVKAMSKKCITKTYFHECSTSCSEECPLKRTPLSKLWICFTGHRKILRGELPAEAVANNLHLEPIPEELQCLNSLEQHLTALHIPFAKLSGLPKGGQYGVHGPVVCVPSNIEKSTNVLPRAESDDQIIRVKLKRRISYKGHHLYKFVNSAHVKNALKFLVANNKWYGDVKFNKHWVNSLPNVVEENEDEINDMDRDDTLPDLTETEISENKTREPDLEDHGMYMDSCLQPVDIGQEVLDQHFDDILCIAPAEGNNPVRLLMDESNEAKSFPVLFPTGGPTYHDDREAKITIARYLHTRLMLADSRFAQNTDYIFYAQYLSEVYQVLSSVSIALRKSYLNAFAKGSKVTAQKLMDRNTLADMLKCDAGYKYLKPIRGTPAFWQASQKDLFAMLRQLGKPTWFCSFSSGDMRWTEIIEAILQEEGDSRNANDLDWSEKCIILKRNPITAARMFDHMFRSFLKDVIMSQAKPIGKIKDYFYRIEFQQRGSPHTHCLFWVEDAPTLDKDSDEEVVSFIDQYITCEMPLNDDELHEIVNAVQKHSSRHSKSCRKKGTVCRFHFPRPPSNTTFISRNDDVESQAIDKLHVQPDKKPNHMTKEEAKQVLMKIWNALQDTENNFDHANALFAHVGINQDLFQEAYEILNKKTDVVLQRNPKDVWVNQYNAHLLRCWNANMDIQYVADAYSCIVYIISYISKTEREMGLLLEHARKEAFNGNEDAKQALKKLGAIYLHNREVSAQEAVFRVCNLRLKESSRKVQFVPTGDNPIKMSLPFDVLKKRSKGKDLDADQIWMTSLPDRYQNRPDQELFDEMCLASFCSEFRVLSKSEVSNVMDVNRKSPIYTLQNGLGHIQRRTRTQPAVIRYPRFSPTKESEKYYQSLLQLFLPYRLESHLKPGQYETFQNFYQNGAVKCGKNEVEPVKYIVERNKAKFELDADSMDKAEEMFQKCGPLDDAWAQICPETEVERLSCLENQKGKTADPQEDIDIPDLLKEEKKSCSIEIRQSIVKKDEAENLLRCLNEKQREIFYAVREWCLNKRNGNEPKPFHVFVTGGAGTGKSHLIKTIQYEASRLLAPILPNPDDVSVLLTAPTGVAAFNINASTIHSTFSISVGAKLPYQPLGDEKINSLRSKLSSLQIIIIDEISMVDQKLITYVHGRLRQIKQCRDFSPFGNVSVIAIGDFYQLSPVKGKSLYAENVGFNLWTDLFHIAELTQIMRQKDGEFAETLNRLRTRKKCDPLDDKDKDTLQKCETGEEPDCIHIYATNEEVDKHNLAKLASSCSNLVAINAEDFYRDPKSGKLQRKEGQYIKVFNTNLARRVTLAVGARVLLTKNIDVSDGLVNGVFGTVSHISQTPGSTFPQMVYVVFDNVKVGQKLRRHTAESLSLPVNSTPIAPQEDRVTNSGGIRRQFPVKLAFGCSIHKIQGCTLKEAVVSLEKIFTAGQAYVALSRVTSMEGLTIQNFKQSAIYCNENVAAAMDSMPSFITPTHTDSTHGKIGCKIILHNIQGLKSHINDIRSDRRFLECNFICLTETWLSNDDRDGKPELENFVFHHKPRQQSYDSPICVDLAQQSHGGVGVYSKTGTHCEILTPPARNLEYLAFHSGDRNIIVAVIYRPSSYNIATFKENLKVLLVELDKFPGGCVVMGDLNEDIFKSSSLAKVMESHGYSQFVTEPTTENGTLIDHVYVRRASVDVKKKKTSDTLLLLSFN